MDSMTPEDEWQKALERYPSGDPTPARSGALG